MESLLKNDKRLFWCNLCYFIVLTLFVILRLASSLNWLDIGKYEDVLFTFIIQILILFMVPFLMYTLVFKQKPKDIFKSFGFRKVSGKVLLCSVGMGIVAFFIIMFVSSFFSIFIQMLGYEPFVTYGSGEAMTFPAFLLSLLTVAVMPGIFEEFSHRGMLLSGYSKMGSVRTIVFSGLLFGLMHLNINQFFYAFVVGMLLALVALVTKSIWPSIIIHFMNNGINTYLDYASSNNLFGGNFNEAIMFPEVNILLRFFIYIVLICAVVYFGIWLLLKMFTYTKERQFKIFVKEFSNIKDPNQQLNIENAEELLKIYMSQGQTIQKELNNLKPSEQTTSIEQENASNQTPQIVMKTDGENKTIQTEIAMKPNEKMTFTKLLEILLPKSKEDKYKPTFKENFFLYCSIFLGAVVTLMTFIWGLF